MVGSGWISRSARKVTPTFVLHQSSTAWNLSVRSPGNALNRVQDAETQMICATDPGERSTKQPVHIDLFPAAKLQRRTISANLR
jgi:hypothetical protein